MQTKYLSLGVIVILLGACGGSKPNPGPSPGPGTGGSGSTVSMQGTGYEGRGNPSFQPGSITVQVGTTVTWSNQDSVLHTTVSDTGVWSSDVGPGGSFQHRFTAAGSFPYKCVIHAGMSGTITVQ